MATEDPKTNNGNNPVPAPEQAPAPAPVVVPTLPPYPELIMAAIESLNEQNGSNKSSISRQIEATYGNLPPAHSTLLTHHLNRMKATGQLVLLKNNYMKPDPNAPPRRGRGRPPKPKPALPAGYVPPPPRPRGRPPKSKDPLAPAAPPKRKEAPPPSAGSGRKRGRPPKMPKTGAAAPVAVPTGPPRGRGRPPKVKPPVPSAATTVGA
ncbi:OLC1v1032097C1 [Oldenlandia corymbosa var. corymbosa]|uniref:HMG-Y-related protein A n=1 Tax=Oldenlandia corymbosa var. corymbosa TaxID=529605 RepID=A0AAV1CLM8_OLDCO|nr:OLC1v1032097C1 [Oldenlandia corymbosa var. corymbosa]